jgi:hypothetical protein
MGIDDYAVEPGQRPRKRGKRRARQKRDFGPWMHLSDFMEGLETKDQIPQGAKANDKDMFLFGGHKEAFFL